MIREPIQQLAQRIRAEPSVQHEPGFIAWRLLELDRNYKQWYQASETGQLRSTEAFDDWMRDVNTGFRRVVDADIYPDSYLGLVLSDEELDLVTQALIERLKWDPEGALSALGHTLKLEVVPPLLEIARSTATVTGPPNAQHGQGAVQAVETILLNGPLDPRHLRPDDEELLREVFNTLRYVAAEGSGAGLNPRRVAAQVLESLTAHFERSF